MDNAAMYKARETHEVDPPYQAAHAPRPATVLVVDDEPEVREVVTRILQRGGYEVYCAADGQAAIERVAQAQPQIDCILLDMTMLGLSGRQTFDLLQARWPGLPVVLMSGCAESAMSHGLNLHYPSVFVQKPFNIAELQRIVARLIAESQVRTA